MKKLFLLISGFLLSSLLILGQSGKDHCRSGKMAHSSSNYFEYLDAISYSIHLNEINTATKFISGYTDVLLTTNQELTDIIHLELIDLTVDSVFLDGIYWNTFLQTDTTLEVFPDNPINPGDTLMIKVYYSGNPYYDDWGGFHFSGDYAFNLGVGLSEIPHNLGKAWFPCIDNFTDRAIYDIYATLPEGKIAVGSGLLVEEIINPDQTTTYHWHCEHSLPTYLASLAAGDYIAVRDTFNGVLENIPIAIYARPQDSVKIAGSFVNLKSILTFFESCMGPYPWERVGYVGTATGAMEHATNIALPHFAISGSTSYESLITHELTHMWLGDQVTCSSAEEMWLNEGWASFFEIYYATELYDYEDFKLSMRDVLADVLQSCHTPGGDGSYIPLNDIPQTHTYGMTAYDRGSTVAQAIRFYLGDTLFYDGLNGYTSDFSYNHASSYDLRDALTTHTGVDMTGFFDNWVFNAGTPHYSVDSFIVVPAGPEFEITVFVKQKRKGPAFIGDDNIMEVTLMDGAWNMHTERIQFSGETGSKIVLLDFEPSTVLIDLEEQMCDATTDNYKIIKETGDHTYSKTFTKLDVLDISDSAFIQVIHNWAPPDSIKEPVNGLRISDYRYWRIEGIVPETFNCTGYFFYTRNSYLDNTLIMEETDSIVMLYRKDASEDWQDVDFDQLGNWNVGNLIVPDLQLGEYTLAVWDTQVGVQEMDDHGHADPLHIHPNPSNEEFQFELNIVHPCKLSIYDIGGRLVDSFIVDPEHSKLRWNAEHLVEGSYIVSLQSSDDKVLASEKIIFSR